MLPEDLVKFNPKYQNLMSGSIIIPNANWIINQNLIVY